MLLRVVSICGVQVVVARVLIAGNQPRRTTPVLAIEANRRDVAIFAIAPDVRRVYDTPENFRAAAMRWLSVWSMS